MLVFQDYCRLSVLLLVSWGNYCNRIFWLSSTLVGSQPEAEAAAADGMIVGSWQQVDAPPFQPSNQPLH